MTHRLFIYGALRRTALHAWRMEKGRFLGEATVQGTLVAIDWYPGLVLHGNGLVQGELWEIDDKLLAALDEFEGIGTDDRPGEYLRVTASVQCRGEVVEALVYEWQKGIENYRVVENGDWLTEPSAFGTPSE